MPKGYVAVNPKYAEKHPEAVTKIGNYYYRVAVSAGDMPSGVPSHEVYAEKLKEKQQEEAEAALAAVKRVQERVEELKEKVEKKKLQERFERVWRPIVGETQGGTGKGKVAYADEAERTGLPLMSPEEFVAMGYGPKSAAMIQHSKGQEIGVEISEAPAEIKGKFKRILPGEGLKEWEAGLRVGEPGEVVRSAEQARELNKQIEKRLKEQEQAERRIKKIEASLEPYKKGEGYNLTLALYEKAITKEELIEYGFDEKDVKRAEGEVTTAISTKVAPAGYKTWIDVVTHKTYTDAEKNELIKKSPAMRDRLVLSPESGRRLGIEVATFVAPAAKAALPEYTLKDVTATDWAISAVNVALLATATSPGLLSGKALNVISAAGGGVMGFDTAARWTELTPAEKIVGVGGTILFTAPMLVGTIGRVGTALRNLNRVGAIQDINRTIQYGEKIAIEGLKKTGNLQAARLYSKLLKAQTQYADDLAQLRSHELQLATMEEVTIPKSATPSTLEMAYNQARAETEAAIARLRDAVPKSQTAFLKAASKYRDAVTKGMKYDDPLIQAEVQELPHSLDHATRVLVEKAVNPRDLQAIQQELNAAEKALQEVKTKYPTEPSKWYGANIRVSELNTELKIAKIGNMEELSNQLTSTREAIDVFKKQLKSTPKASAYYDEIKRTLEQAKSLETSLKQQIDDAIRLMDIEYPPPPVSGGRGIRRGAPPATGGGGRALRSGETPLLEPAISTAQIPGAGRDTVIVWVPPSVYPRISPVKIPQMPALGTKVITKPRPEIAPFIVWPEKPKPEITWWPEEPPKVPLMPVVIELPDALAALKRIRGMQSEQQITELAAAAERAATQTSTTTGGVIGAKPTTITQPDTQPSIKSASAVTVGAKPTPAVEPSVAATVEPAPVSTPTLETTPVITPTPPVPPIRIPTLVSSKDRPTKKQLESAEAWPQGFGWWVVYTGNEGELYRYFHYGQRPPKGVRMVESGEGEAYRGIQQHRGTKPVSYRVPMGAVDVAINRPVRTPGRAGAIRFTQSRPRITKSKILPGATKSSTITAKKRGLKL